MPILEALGDYSGMNFGDSTWGYQGGYQPNTYTQQPGAWQQAPPPQVDTFDLNAYEQRQQGGYVDQQQQQQQPNGFQY